MAHVLSMDQALIEKLNTILEVNLERENFGVNELAKEAGLSRSQLLRKLKYIKGKSTSKFISEFRLKKAMEMLQNNEATASEIAYRVGFGSPTYFNTCFNDYYGYPPGEVKFRNPKTDKTQHEKANADALDVSDNITEPTVAKKSSFGKKMVWVNTIAIVLLCVVSYYLYSSYKDSLPTDSLNTGISNTTINEKSIAVLPLHNLTGQVENDYFVDGMHDALIGELGKLSSLRVISRTSTLGYRENDKLLKDISNELGVNTIVEGSVIGAGDSLRVLIQLIEVFPKERHIFTKNYDDDMHNVLKFQSEVVKDIADNIDIKLLQNEEQRLEKSREVDPETYKAYLRGLYYLNQGTEESFDIGINFLQEAIDRDPGDPFAYAGLSLGYTIVGHGQLNSEEAFLRASSSAMKAIKLDPSLDEPYTALSILNLYTTWDWSKAKESFENAIAKNPNNEIAHAHYAWYHVLFNDMDKSIYHAKQAAMIEPSSASYAAWLGLLYFENQEYTNAEYWAKKALMLKENIPYGNCILGDISLHKKQYKQAIEFYEKLPKGVYWNTLLGHGYVKAGQKDKALALWNELEGKKVNPCYKGMMAASLGFTDEAFELLNEACDKKYYPITYINYYACTESIRKDPRYDELLKKMDLPHRREIVDSNQ